MTLISICICTYRRNSVADAIDSLLEQRDLPAGGVEIVVCDDDPDGSARKLVAGKAASAKLPIRYVHSGARNIAACRNACLAAAAGDWIAFIDDDEVATPDWLAQLLAARDRYGCAGVKGFVQAVYPDETPDWVRRGDPFTCDYGPNGQEISVGATGNVLFDRRLVMSEGLRFDPALGRTGGEDLKFFDEMKRRGALVVSCRDAVVYERVPPGRVSEIYLQRRSRRFGHIDGRVLVARRPPLGRAWVLFKSLAAVGLCWGYPFARSLPGDLPSRMFGRFWYHLGVIEWALGRTALRHE